MKHDQYDKKTFFYKYSKMSRSVKGLSGAGEWETLKKVLPRLKDKRVLDLGCGFGWHCQYAVELGATAVVGVDASRKMMEVAKKNTSNKILYLNKNIEDIVFPKESFDIVISSLTLHYIEDYKTLIKKIYNWLSPSGIFVFSVEHPVFTAYGSQDWYYDPDGKILHFPVDKYFYEGEREANFLGEKILKQHRTLTTYLQTLIQSNFKLQSVVEPQPSKKLLKKESMKNELRRPMMLIISAKKI